jgi:hypothetical protein
MWGNFSCSLSRVERLSCRICFFQVLSDGDGSPDRSSLWTFVLPSNIRHHFLTLDSFITPSPYSVVSCLWMTIARTFCAFNKRITDRTSVGGIIYFLIYFKHSLKLFKWWIETKLTWNKANGRLRSSDLESARSVYLRERYAQTVFTFWTTLVYVI